MSRSVRASRRSSSSSSSAWRVVAVGPAGGEVRRAGEERLGVGPPAVEQGQPVDHVARGHRLHRTVVRESVRRCRERRGPAEGEHVARQLDTPVAQPALQAVAEQCADRLARAHPVEELQRPGHALRTEVECEGAGGVSPAARRPLRRIAALAACGTDGAWTYPRLAGASRGPQVLHPAEAADVSPAHRLAQRVQPARGQGGHPRVEPVRAAVERLGGEALELGLGQAREVLETGPELRQAARARP